jgi:transposase
MASKEEKVNCVLWLAKLKSVTAVQRIFRTYYNTDAPHRNSIKNWMNRFKETRSVNDKSRSGRPCVSEEHVASVEQSFNASPRKSVRRASLELGIPASTVRKILRVKHNMKAYKIQVHQMLLEEDYHTQLNFCHQFNEKFDSNASFIDHLMFSDEATFHISGKVNRHNCCIWGIEKPQEVEEHERDSPKVNVWCALGKDRIIGPFFFEGWVVNSESYLEMLQNYYIPELTRLGPIVIQCFMKMVYQVTLLSVLAVSQ